ncbi:MAG: chemotaxis protein CheA [Halobacteriota archaeon]|nr:chemotaxis protein CheA [Halobacteriota archaeon]
MEVDMAQYKEEFVNESREHLEVLNQSLLELEDDPHNMDLLNNIFRSAHTLKGSSATMGYTNVSELTHKMENVLDLMRNGQIEANTEIMDMLFECFDTLEVLIGEIEEGVESEVDVSSLVGRLEEIKKGEKKETLTIELDKEEKEEKTVEEAENVFVLSDDEKKKIRDATDQKLSIFKVKVALDENCSSNSIRAMMLLKALEKRGTIFATAPNAKKIEKGLFDLNFEVLIGTSEDMGTVKSEIEAMNEISSVGLSVFTPSKLEELKEAEKKGKKEIKESPKKDKKEDDQAKTEKTAMRSVQSVRVSIEKMDSLVNLVGELVINKIRLMDIERTYGFKELDETTATIDRLTTELRDEVMQMRMVPVGQVFNRFPRMVRDLSKKKGKDLNFEIVGSEIELDRTVLDEIGEPLVHLLRNSVDHGIEPPEEREKSGKEARGTIELIARREKDHVLIEINDDGAGIDPDKLRKKTVEKGLLTQAEADSLTDEDAQALIFLPGLSTSKEITDTSGRGVGMDVVKTKIESLGGDVRLSSKIGVGSKVTLQLPLTMAIIQAMLVKVMDQTFAIPITNILEITYVPNDRVQNIGNDSVTTLRGNILPLKSLHSVIGVKEADGDERTVVVMDKGTKLMGLVVDSVVGQQEVVIKSLDSLLKNVKGFAGATILGDGRVILILDITTLF